MCIIKGLVLDCDMFLLVLNSPELNLIVNYWISSVVLIQTE